MRTLLLTSFVVEFVGNHTPVSDQHCFWQHALLTATVSESIARLTGYPHSEQAYLAGLLHDIGVMPLLTGPWRQRAAASGIAAGEALESGEIQKWLFNLDHCELGGQIGMLWSFPRPMIEVFRCHHAPRQAGEDEYLVSIVAFADQFCRNRDAEARAGSSASARIEPVSDQEKLKDFMPWLDTATRARLSQTLEVDYKQMFQWLGFSFTEPFFRGLRFPSEGDRPG